MSDSVVPTVPQVILSEDDLGAVQSFADAMQLMQDARVDVVSTDDLGDGFVVLPTDGKASLVGVPFIILNMRFHTGDMGEFVILHVVTEDGRKLIVNDGSTGIRDQCKGYARNNRTQGILCKRGLTRSDYTYEDDKGKSIPATTYYLG
ncbi:MAG TPA: hypothetical protein VN039_00025 [Nitrospira sp.]|nr:hypothetical protein [Nitrospira sp.]